MTDTDITDAPRITARIIDMETGDIELREFASAAEARRMFAREAGRMLVWEQGDTRWTATLKGREYQVDMDHKEAEEGVPAAGTGTPAQA